MKDEIDTQIRHITPADGNVFLDLGFPPEEAAALHAESQSQIDQEIAIKEQLMAEISNWIVFKKMRQIDAANMFYVSRPRISDVVNKKTEKFTLDSLIGMVHLMGKRVRLVIE